MSIRFAPIPLRSLYQHHSRLLEFITTVNKHSQPLKGSATSG